MNMQTNHRNLLRVVSYPLFYAITFTACLFLFPDRKSHYICMGVLLAVMLMAALIEHFLKKKVEKEEKKRVSKEIQKLKKSHLLYRIPFFYSVLLSFYIISTWSRDTASSYVIVSLVIAIAVPVFERIWNRIKRA
ncbi:hypothetical protein [Porphyromonas canoris]|uniref:hypothetical protein n=1 Tax=Porphyromonas canoris TaxID=36875 RepID=UPI00126A00B5|nr:hypothetical protein [Porphyromonas canoris]